MEAIREESEPLVERRRLPRLKVSTPVQFRDVLKPQETFTGSLSKEISVGGIRMNAPGFVAQESRLVLLLSLPSLLKPMRAIGRVVWVREQPFAQGYDCGVQFVEIAPEDREALADYVERGIVQAPGR